jgi:beta-lactamase regulating signal transducer with metallopeptidase domain
MMLLLNTSVKVTVIVVVALAATAVLRRRSAAVRHFVLAAALGCAAATPALRLVVPAWQASVGAWMTESRLQFIDRPLAVFEPTALDGVSTASPAAAATWPSAIAHWIVAVWLAGAAASLAVLAVGLFWLARLRSQSQQISNQRWRQAAAEIARGFGLRRVPVLLQGEQTPLVATWGFARPVIILPPGAASWSADRIRIVLAHELAHVRRGDWLVQLGAELLRAAYWFNPLVWMACRRLRLESEQACDDAVLQLGVDSATYATELVDLARAFRSQPQPFVPAVAIARSSSLERRVRAMLNLRLNRDPLTRSASLAAAALLAAITVLVASFGAAAQSFSTVSGSLVDPLTRPMPGATVTLSNPENQSKYEIKSDPSGHYEFVGVIPGTYVLIVTYPGFATVKREGVSLEGQPFQQNLTMQVGSLQETITVDDTPVSVSPVRELPALVARRGQPGACTSTAVGGNIRPPAKIRDVRPLYPTGAAPGQVVLEARIGTDGFVTSAAVVGDADPALAHAATTAVSQWGFTPTLLDCQPIDVRMNVNINFISAK